ncbi:Hsp70 family protein [Parachitinimonas caeni]|uniref:Molecular chaperone HscC n=1 Tax=Parachitinimonas caeni TaxID=3031301 RepID=A0ABT7DT09_9NEIS|nr:molecular chaperone HscC [Parachitinimonas caeni]MDK2123211.1 molecular chaperone HscC [Parachitinimonas caeni]
MIIGIDLGTTNSLVAVWRDGKAQTIPNALGHMLTPSVVGFDDQGEILVGLPARERMLTHPQLTTALFKRYMGSDRSTRLGNQQFRPEELSALVLRSLKADAERFLGETVTEAVITVPAYFSDAQRKATKIAGQLAGLTVERIVNEPTAAALAYGLHDNNPESKFLVFDLGGGTFDISILELFEGVMEVRASAGDNFLGGEDFGEALVDGFIDAVKPALDHFDKQADQALYQQLRQEAERAKRMLSSASQATMSLPWQGQTLEWTISDDMFAQSVQPLLNRLREPIERALRDARIRVAELDHIVLAGGATRMPLVKKLVARMFGRLPSMHLNPDEVVALGAAVQAGLKARDAALNEVVMTDVCPYTLGVDVSEEILPGQYQPGFFLPIIERNSVVPISREQTVTTISDNQPAIHVRIFQGESRLVKDNIFLGELTVPTPPRPSGQMVSIRFTYDVNGLLEAEMTVAETGEKHRLVIEENPGVLKAEEIEEKLRALTRLKIHPRDQLPNTALLTRAERLYQQALGEDRLWVGQLTNAFQAALERQDNADIEQARENLKSLLDEIEGESWL